MINKRQQAKMVLLNFTIHTLAKTLRFIENLSQIMATTETNVVIPVNILNVKNGSFETPALSIAVARLGPNTAIPIDNNTIVTPEENCSVFNMDAVIGDPVHNVQKIKKS